MAKLTFKAKNDVVAPVLTEVKTLAEAPASLLSKVENELQVIYRDVVKEVEVEKQVIVEVIKEVPKEITVYVDRIEHVIKEVPVEVIKEIEKLVEVPVLQTVEKLVLRTHIPLYVLGIITVETIALIALLLRRL